LRWIRHNLRPPDGMSLGPGDVALELHLWNEHLRAIPAGGATWAWGVGTTQDLLWSLRSLADWIGRSDEAETIAYLEGTTILLGDSDQGPGLRLAERLGFSSERAESSWGTFGEVWEARYARWLIAAFNPNSGSAYDRGDRTRRRLWISRRALLDRYG
jgi:hypothetical protein